MLRYALFATAVTYPLFAAAAPSTVSDQVTACSIDKSGDKRLECYDEIARQLQGPPSLDPTPQVANDQSNGSQAEIKNGDTFGRWRAEVSVDAMTDKKNVSFVNAALPGQSDDAAEARIGLLCLNKHISLIWLSKAYIGKDASSMNNVSYRFDAEKPRSEKWNTFQNGAMADDAVPVVRIMVDAKRFVFNVRDFNFASHQAVFDLDGVTDVLGQLSACWPPSPPSPPGPAAEAASSAPKSAPAPVRTTKQKLHG